MPLSFCATNQPRCGNDFLGVLVLSSLSRAVPARKCRVASGGVILLTRTRPGDGLRHGQVAVGRLPPSACRSPGKNGTRYWKCTAPIRPSFRLPAPCRRRLSRCRGSRTRTSSLAFFLACADPIRVYDIEHRRCPVLLDQVEQRALTVSSRAEK